MARYQIEIRQSAYGFSATVVQGEHQAAVNRVMKTERGALSEACRLIRRLEAASEYGRKTKATS